MSSPSNPAWRYGVYAFPLVPFLSALSYVGFFVGVPSLETTPSVFLIGFALSVLSQWVAVIASLVVCTALALDVRALRDSGDWRPNPYLFGAGGLVHVAGAVLVAPYLFSIPVLGYYVYQRRQRVE